MTQALPKIRQSALPYQDTPEALGVLLRQAVENGDYHQAEMLILCGANLNQPSPQLRSTPLHVAAWKPNENLVSLLLRYGADPNFETHQDNRSTPTHFVAQCGSTFSLGQMIEHGANIDVQNKAGNTPMHCAAYAGAHRIPNIIALLDAGANPHLPNDDGLDVLGVAKSRGYGDVLEAVLAQYESMPKFDDRLPLTKRSLFEPNDKGFCLLDAPDTWHRFSDVCSALEAQGEFLTKADLMQTGIHGKTWLQRAAECRALPEVLQALSDSGQAILSSDLLKKGEDGPLLLQGLIDTATLPHVFNADVWSESASTLRQTFDVLPERGKELIYNLHQLLADIARRNRARPQGWGR